MIDPAYVQRMARYNRWQNANLYGVAVCPQITLADRGGRVVKTLIGERNTTAAALRRELGALARRAQ